MRLVKAGEGAAEAAFGLDSSSKKHFFYTIVSLNFHVEFFIFSVALEKGHFEIDPCKFTEVGNLLSGWTFLRVQFLDRAQDSL